MGARVIEKTTENTNITPPGATVPTREPDLEITVIPDLSILNAPLGVVVFNQNIDVLEHTIWIQQNQHEAHQVKERYRLYIGGQHEKPRQSYSHLPPSIGPMDSFGPF